MFSCENDYKFADGVVLNHFTRNSGKFLSLYSEFWIPADHNSYARFQVGHVYTVTTNGVPGFAKLKSIYHIREIDECFCTFGLYHKPENIGEGKLLWQPDKDEVFSFENDIRIRCKNAILWLDHSDTKMIAMSESGLEKNNSYHRPRSPSTFLQSTYKTLAAFDEGSIGEGVNLQNDIMTSQAPRAKGKTFAQHQNAFKCFDEKLRILPHNEYIWYKQRQTFILSSENQVSTSNSSCEERVLYHRYTFQDDSVRDFYLFDMKREKTQSQKEKLRASRDLFLRKEIQPSKKRKRGESTDDNNDIVGSILNAMTEKPSSRKGVLSAKKKRRCSSPNATSQVSSSQKLNNDLNDTLQVKLRKTLAD